MKFSSFLRLFLNASLLAFFLLLMNKKAPVVANEPALQSLARLRDFYIGAAASINPLINENEYHEILKREFNVCVAENSFKFSELQPQQGVFKFDDADKIVEFTQANDMKLRGHTLVWHRQLPKWIKEGRFNREAAITLMRDHIYTVLKRYQGKVYCWDVVNEAIDDEGKSLRKDSFWYQTIGPDYIKLAFKFAREADPDALLYYNDYSAEDMGDKSKAVYKLVRELKQTGVPIDGVGWQMHVDNNFKIKPSHRENAKRLAELGLEISITELDVRIISPAPQEEHTKQANVYHDIAQFCLTTPNCKTLLMWGFTDKYSWIPKFYPGTGEALVFDSEYRPKPAYYGLKNAIQDAASLPPVITDVTIKDGSLVITGNNFNKGSAVFLNWKQIKAAPDKQALSTRLIVKKAGKNLQSKVTLQVQNPEGKLSSEYHLTRE